MLHHIEQQEKWRLTLFFHRFHDPHPRLSNSITAQYEMLHHIEQQERSSFP
jgi:hypothetical protein